MRYEYDAFGNIVYQDGSLESFGFAQDKNSYQYQTKEYDSQSGLVYFGTRYYDPTIGRFTTADPLGMFDGPNVYLYVNNNPIGFVDSWGLCGRKKDEEGRYWPKWIEIFIPGYGNYGGPIRTDPTFKMVPTDSMDALFREHDILWAKGQGREADKKLLEDLYCLPSDPREWENPARYPMIANFYRRNIVEPYFWWVNKRR